MFFERSKEDESAKPTIMLMEVTNPLRKDGQTIAKEVADIFDEFAGVKSSDQYGKEDTNSRSVKVVVSISYNTEEEKTQWYTIQRAPCIPSGPKRAGPMTGRDRDGWWHRT
ncbi:hypothetical protein BDR26DRAFT_901708 [Obelidium mucronatum]|nr:hypothetical protein BDR26DRAFT_901708 [Obelidium mucronatum]